MQTPVAFTSATVMNAFSPLYLYLMGMFPKEQVTQMMLIDNPDVVKDGDVMHFRFNV